MTISLPCPPRAGSVALSCSAKPEAEPKHLSGGVSPDEAFPREIPRLRCAPLGMTISLPCPPRAGSVALSCSAKPEAEPKHLSGGVSPDEAFPREIPRLRCAPLGMTISLPCPPRAGGGCGCHAERSRSISQEASRRMRRFPREIPRLGSARNDSPPARVGGAARRRVGSRLSRIHDNGVLKWATKSSSIPSTGCSPTAIS